MKKINLFLVAVLVLGVFALTGCKEDPTKNFKNPKEITIKSSKKGETIVTYDDDGNYEVETYGDEKLLKNSEADFRITFRYATDTLKQVKDKETNFKKDKNWKVVSDLEYNGYKAFALISKTNASAEVYVFLDEDNEAVLRVNVSHMKSHDYDKEIKKDPAKLLFDKEKVQQTLKTVKYSK